MATFSVTTPAAVDKAVAYIAAKRNAANEPGEPDVTALEVARDLIAHWFNGLLQQMLAETQATKGELYNRASDADQAAIDAILAKYR